MLFTSVEALDFSSLVMQPCKAAKKRVLSALFTAAERDDLVTFARFSQLPEKLITGLIETEHKQRKRSSFKFSTTLLMHAFSTNSNIDVVTYIVDVLKADIEHCAAIRHHQHNRPVTPLWAATFFNQPSTVRILVERGASVNKFTEHTKSTALHVACQNGNLEIVEYLVANGALVDAVNKYGQTGLMLACCKGSYNVVKFLVGLAGVDVNRVCNLGMSALHYAVSSKVSAVSDIMELLVSHGAQLTRDKDGLTPPMMSALYGYGSIHLIKRFATARRNHVVKENGRSENFMSNEEKADTFELAGCCLINRVHLPEVRPDGYPGRKPTLEEIKNGVCLWLRAERLRMQSSEPLDYKSSSLLMSTLEKVAGNLQPVGILSESESTTEDEAIVDQYTKSTSFETMLLHAYIRRERIIGPFHLASIEQIVRLAEKQCTSSQMLLLEYAFASALKGEAQTRGWIERVGGKIRLTCELHLKLLKALLQPLRILQLVDKCLCSNNYASALDFYFHSHLVRLLKLTVEELERAALSHTKRGDCNLSVLLTSAVLLTFITLRCINKMRLEDQQVMAIGEIERILVRACSSRLRAGSNYSILHIAALNRMAMHAFLFDSLLTQAIALDPLYLVDHFCVPFLIDVREFFTTDVLPDSRVLMLLLRCGAEANARDVCGNTALHLLALQHVKYVTNGHGHTFEASNCNHRDEDCKDNERLNEEECSAFKAIVEDSLRLGVAGNLQGKLVTFFDASLPFRLQINQRAESYSAVPLRIDNIDEQPADFVLRLNYLVTSVALRVLLACTHADIRNVNGETYLDVLLRARRSLLVASDVLVGQTDAVAPLKCLCARRVRTLKLQSFGHLPKPVHYFINLH